MPTELTGNVAAISIRLGGISTSDIRVTELNGREGLNQLFEYTVQLSSWRQLDLDAALSSPCTLEITAGSGTRYIHGVIRSFEQVSEHDHYVCYVAQVVPLVWLLTKRYGSRIFQQHNCPDMTVPGIIRKVLSDAGIPDDMFRFVLPRALPVHDYVVQYRETERDFIWRLMEDEGLACYFEHTADGHVLVIGEAPVLFRENTIYEAVPYQDANGMDVGMECVTRFRERRTVEYGATGLNDYDFKRPGVGLWTRSGGGRAAYQETPTAPDSPDYNGSTQPSPSFNGKKSPSYNGKPPATYGRGEGKYHERTSERPETQYEREGYSGETPASNPPGEGYRPGTDRQAYHNRSSSSYGEGGGYNGKSSSYGGNGAAYGGNGAAYGGSPGGPGKPGYNGNGASYGGATNKKGGTGYGGNGSSYGGTPGGNGNSGYGGGGSAYGESGYKQAGSGYSGESSAEAGDYGAAPNGEGYESGSGGSGSSSYESDQPAEYDRYPYSPPQPPRHWPKPPPPADYGSSQVWLDYPGGYADRGDGQRRSQIRLEEHQCNVRVFEMIASARGLCAGLTFTIEYHPVEELNGDYLVTELVLRAKQPQSAEEDAYDAEGFRFEAHVRAVRAGVAYRPPRCTPRPVVHGAQTAIVVGPSSEEIYTDAYGRVKVQFHWDREGCYDEYSSCWIRVSQGSAGGQYGMMFLPRVGHEVIVDFLEGNPNRPIITGRVYNGDQMPPYSLPDDRTKSCIKTHSTPGGGGTNEIRFEDKKGYEQLLVYAEKELHLRSKSDCVETVGGNRHEYVGGSGYQLTKYHQHNVVKLNRVEKVGGDASLLVCGKRIDCIEDNHYEECRALYVNAHREVVIEAQTAITFKVGGNFIKIDAAGVHVVGTLINLNSGGSPGISYQKPPKTPKYPRAADWAKPGCDISYSSSSQYNTPTEPGQPDHGYDAPGENRKKTSWVEIEMVDEAGRPWKGEEYEIITPEGTVLHGTLDENGQAHVAVETDGDCQIRFPKLDAAAWERR